MILSLNLFLAPFGSIQMALMRKKLNYKPISYSNICNVIVNSSLSVLLAMNDCGAISLRSLFSCRNSGYRNIHIILVIQL